MRRHHLLVAVLAAAVAHAAAAGEERLTSTDGEIVIRPMAHSSVQIEFAGQSIYVDPWSAVDLSQSPRSSLILVTDADEGQHHLDVRALSQLRAAGGTVVVPAAGRVRVPDGIVLDNGGTRTFGGIKVEAIAAYDVTPGAPFHEKGGANGYVLTLGGKRVYFAGVTECVPEIRALRDIDIAFLPMNLPQGRMTPAAVADCVRAFKPKVVCPYHYDQGYIARRAGRGDPASASIAAASVRTLADALKGIAEVRDARFYPAP